MGHQLPEVLLQALGSLPLPIRAASYSYLCQHPYRLLCRCTHMSGMIMYRVVCVNPRRRRWCRDGIPDPGNAGQIPSLRTAISLCSAVAVLPGQWRCRCDAVDAGASGTSNASPALSLRQNKFHSKAPLSINFYRWFHLLLLIFHQYGQHQTPQTCPS